MARTGITYHEVANAAQQLFAQGKNPTIQSIRLLTGTGSNSTIAQHFTIWKNKQDDTRLLCIKENLPEEIVLTMKGLWERVMNQAEVTVTAIKQELEQTIAELKEQNKKLQEDNTRWQQQYHQMKHEKDEVASDKSVLEQVVRQLENEKIALTVTKENMTKQLQDKQDHIDKLHRLNQQAQANLEHYHEASREQRVTEQQRNEQIQAQLEQTIQHLRQEVTALNQQKTSIQNDHQQMLYAKEVLESQHDQLNKQYGIVKLQLAQAEKNAIQYSHAEQHWKSQNQNAQKKLDEQSTMLIDLQTKIGVLTEKFSAAQDELKEMSGQNKYLANEKWILTQEKAEVIGQLKQFEKLAV